MSWRIHQVRQENSRPGSGYSRGGAGRRSWGDGQDWRQAIQLRRQYRRKEHIRLRIQQRGRSVAGAAYSKILYSVLNYLFFEIYITLPCTDINDTFLTSSIFFIRR
jgi:hypothetical protein